ncbi:hypothetical protein [Streptomyces nanshensis]|uniref:FtsK domain-containing protein n=1 Tax=Streptomyces nanshensis TaxID=518642 RepID=A0A1E7LC58_9ACTN|nr:hypothetical protein [Streptomyces nanshensis]OEV13740.1 hypothetical protein AN218_02070 [Streptomyces nanshensis]
MSDQTAIPIPALRSTVRLSDPHTAAALAAADEPLLGLAGGDRPVHLPAGADHVLIATGSGGGTTSVLRALAAQVLARGAELDVLVPGTGAHRWAEHLPHVTYLSTIEAIHDRLLIAAAGLNDGTRQWSGWRGRQVILIEDVTTLVYGLRQYWQHTRPETQLEEAPGIEALVLLLFHGPARGVQILAGNARGDFPGTEGRPVSSLCPTRVLANGGIALWQRVAPEVWPVPPPSIVAGRVHLAMPGRPVTTLQALYLDDREARALARQAPTPGEER